MTNISITQINWWYADEILFEYLKDILTGFNIAGNIATGMENTEPGTEEFVLWPWVNLTENYNQMRQTKLYIVLWFMLVSCFSFASDTLGR